MKTQDELIAEVGLSNDRRDINVAGIKRYYDSIISPLGEMTAHVWADHSDINVSLSGNTADLTKFFRLMRSNGFVPDFRPKDAQNVFNTWFRHEDGTQFYLSFSSTVCRRVQVGTQMVETPIYETVCSDDPTPADVFVESAPVADEVPF
jgi:hypothetical protein